MVRQLLQNKGSAKAAMWLSALLFAFCADTFAAETVLKYDFNDPSVMEGISFTAAGTGSMLTVRQYSSNAENIHEGAGSMLLTFKNTAKNAAEWKIASDDFEGISISGLSFWVKSVYAKDEICVIVRDSKKESSVHPVVVSDNKWRRIEVTLDGKSGIDRSSVNEFAVGFTSASPSGFIFLDELEFYGTKRAGKQAVAIEPMNGKPVVEPLEYAQGISAIRSNYTGKPPIAKLVRPFKRTKSDLKAVSKMLLAAAKNDPVASTAMSDEEFMDMVQQRAFLFFWYEANPETGVTLDRGRCFETTNHAVGSNASVGHMLTAMGIAHSRGWISYEQAYDRVLKTLKFHRDKTRNVEGFYYHFVDIKTGERVWNCELSTIDTSLFLCGVLFAMEYFKGTEIEKVGNDLYTRVNWRWAHQAGLSSTKGGKFASMGWTPESGFIDAAWNRYCESLFIAILELGHPTANIDKSVWYDIEKSRNNYKGFECISQTGPLFGYQYQHLWFDLRNKTDGFADHFEISVNETLANRQYAIDLMGTRKGYGPDSWGFTACDGPGGYAVYAAPPGPAGEDGTIAPTGPGGSFAFTPHLSMKALRHMYDTWRDDVWGKYGFCDSYNVEKNWFAGDNIGIDQGPILLAIENYRTGLVWKYTMRNKYIRAAFNKIGFQDLPRASAKVLPLDLSGSDWLLNLSDSGEYSRQTHDDTSWKRVYVPDKWENQLMKNYDGTGWYRKHFKVSKEVYDSWVGRPWALHIGGIDDKDEIYLNGYRIGARSGWDFERVYTVDPKLLKPDEDNVIAVRVTDNAGDGGIWMRPVEIGPYIQYDWKPFIKQ